MAGINSIQTSEVAGLPESRTNNNPVRVATVTALLALSLVAGNPAQAEPPTNIQVASAAVPSAKGVSTMTQDGRKFSVLSESDVDGLTRQEKKAYYAWKNQQLDATIVSKRTEGQQLDATIVSEDKANEGRKATINQNNQKIALTARNAFPTYELLLKQTGTLNTLSIDAKEMIRYVAQYKIPPELASQAEKFLKYI